MVVGPFWAARWKRARLGNLLAARAKRIEKGGGVVGPTNGPRKNRREERESWAAADLTQTTG
jgi:hypothetical protein